MVPTTDPFDIAAFYDWLSPDYDRMTSFDQRFAREQQSIKHLVEVYGIHTALDAGTGTGFLALVLAQIGVTVTAVDLSPSMIEQLSRNARRLGIGVNALVGAFKDISGLVQTRQDAVFSLGNTLAHSASQQELIASLTAFHQVLRPGGILIVQLLNYVRILSTRDRVQNVREDGSTRFTRWYEYEGERVRFHITREQVGSDAPGETRTVVLRPVTGEELMSVLPEAGFGDVSFYGGMTMDPYDPLVSKDCVVHARA